MRISVNTAPFARLDAGLASVSKERIEQAEAGVVNKVTERAYDIGRRTMIAGINLPDSYLRERMAIVPASPGNLTSIIRASYRHTLLARYTPQVVAKGSGKGGVSVEVTRGGRKTLPGAFLMRLKNGNGLGVFIRTNGKLKILYGPSVYQLFRASIEKIVPSIQTDLEQSSVIAVSQILREALE